jgi:hypothetical protein
MLSNFGAALKKITYPAERLMMKATPSITITIKKTVENAKPVLQTKYQNNVVEAIYLQIIRINNRFFKN